jgi:Zn-dependent M16 (insulinase) family peptidase
MRRRVCVGTIKVQKDPLSTTFHPVIPLSVHPTTIARLGLCSRVLFPPLQRPFRATSAASRCFSHYYEYMMPAAKPMSHFKPIQKFKLDYAPIDIAQYESTRTGMRVVVVEQKGPKVYGYFALATEIHDDSGSPHTLEHLCFMGSKNYRYKGVLDKLATRAYSNTNAWTATDHTAYTLETAGWEGFAQILPVYLEHVLVPTLTDAGCYTEVFHVDGTGHDAGVVYSEMQGVQNQQGELMELQARRLM